MENIENKQNTIEQENTQTLDWELILPKLEEMDLVIDESFSSDALSELANIYGFISHNKFVNLSAIDGIDTEWGLIVTYQEEFSNNGVYIFCVQHDTSIGLFVITPSTISKAPMISEVTGNFVTAMTGVDTPPLTTFDKTEIYGTLIVDTMIKPLMDALNIPPEKRDNFVNLYLPRFLSNVARQYLGDETLKEEVVEMEPQMVKQMVLQDQSYKDLATYFTEDTKSEDN